MRDKRMTELDRLIPVPGPSARPGVWIDGKWRCDRKAKELWMRERMWRKGKRRAA